MILSAAAGLLLTACASTPLDDSDGGLSALDQMQVPVIMSVLPNVDDASDPYDNGKMPVDANNPLLAAESAINPNRLFVAAYNATDDRLLDVLYAGGDASKVTTNTVRYTSTLWGTTFAFTLDNSPVGGTGKGKYDEDFYIVALAIPAEAKSEYTFPAEFADVELSIGEAMKDFSGTLKEYQENVLDRNLTTQPDVFIPMAGCELITNEWFKDMFDRDRDGLEALRLPNIRMTRALAKIIIEDVDGILDSAEITHNAAGQLLPPGKNGGIWWSTDGVSFSDMPDAVPHMPSGAVPVNTLTQTSFTIAGSEDGDNPKKGSKYVFYSYEHDFTSDGGKAADDAARGLITLTPTAESNLQGTKTIYIAPYEGGKVSEKTYDQISDLENGAWRGLLRNHCYTFSVTKPANGDIQIYVKATQWTHHRIPFDF